MSLQKKSRNDTKIGKKILIENWKGSFPVIMVIYIFLEILVTFVCTILKDTFIGYETYRDAQHPIIAILFWIVIIQYNYSLFENTYKELKIFIQKVEPSTEKNRKLEEWKDKVEDEFGLSIDKVEVFLLVITTCFVILCYFFLEKGIYYISYVKYGCKMAIVFLIAIMGLSLFDSKDEKTFKVSCFVALCGLSYYVYIIKIYENPLPVLVSDGNVFVNILIMFCVICVFFIAGLAINPLICSLKAFYFLNLKEVLDIQHAQISETVDGLKCIKKYFSSLTFSAIFAYFQLFWIVRSLGILEKREIVTSVLFVLGTVFPMSMFMASNYLFKKLCYELFLGQMEKFEYKISKWVDGDENFDKVQTLMNLRNCYMQDLKFKLLDNMEMFLATILPIITSLITVAKDIGIFIERSGVL